MTTTRRTKTLAFFDVDTQRDFMVPSGKLYVPGARQLGPRIRRLIAAARRHGIRVFSSVDAHPEGDPEFQVFPPHCVVGTVGQAKMRGTLLPDPAVVPAEPALGVEEVRAVLEHPQVIFEKQSYDVFDNPHVRRVLAASGAKRFVVFGVATDYCVRAVVLGLCRCGYDVTVATDAITGIAPDTTERSLDEMRAAGARFETAEQVLAKLGA
jgi:nicotinamidase/pyrazinamidase